MSVVWSLVVLGVFAGSIYGLAAMGVVLTYKTAGVFNFAYGAIAMFCAYTYWKLHDAWHLTAWIALPLLLVVVAPVIGLLLERLFSPLSGERAEVQIVVSLGVLALLEAATPLLYGGEDRGLQPIFPRSTFRLGSLHVGWDQLGTLLVSLVLGGGLWWLLRHTRFGTATRAVVDNRDLAGIIGINGDWVRRVAWMVSSVFAALVGVLLSPSQGLDVYVLTVVVIYTFAPAVLGRLVSLPWAYAGGIVLGVVMSLLTEWSSSGTVADLEASIPYLALFVLLVVLGSRLREAGLAVRPVRSAPAPTAGARRGLGRSLAVGTPVFGALFALPLALGGPHLGDVTSGVMYAVIAVSLVVLTGWAGQISLAQFSFVGIGAFTVGHLAGTHGQTFVPAALAGMAIAVPLGLLVGLASLRLSGLYLALATMAFALLMDNLVFNRPGLTGGYTGITVPRPRLGGISFASPAAFHELVVGVLAVVVLGAALLHHGPVGRRLQILRDSPLAASTLGVNLTVTKLVTFAACGALAALGGALYGAGQRAITPADFTFSASLQLLLLVVLGGRAVLSGALLAGAVYSVQLFPLPITVIRYIPLAVAFGVIFLARQPEGTVATSAGEARRILTVLRPLPRPATVGRFDGSCPAPIGLRWAPAGTARGGAAAVAAGPGAPSAAPGTATALAGAPASVPVARATAPREVPSVT